MDLDDLFGKLFYLLRLVLGLPALNLRKKSIKYMYGIIIIPCTLVLVYSSFTILKNFIKGGSFIITTIVILKQILLCSLNLLLSVSLFVKREGAEPAKECLDILRSPKPYDKVLLFISITWFCCILEPQLYTVYLHILERQDFSVLCYSVALFRVELTMLYIFMTISKITKKTEELNEALRLAYDISTITGLKLKFKNLCKTVVYINALFGPIIAVYVFTCIVGFLGGAILVNQWIINNQKFALIFAIGLVVLHFNLCVSKLYYML